MVRKVDDVPAAVDAMFAATGPFVVDVNTDDLVEEVRRDMTGAMRRDGGSLDGARIAVLIESDYFEPEIHYYHRRFAEEGAEVYFLTRLWGQQSQTFTGHEWRAPFVAERELRGRRRRVAAVLRRGDRALRDGLRPAALHRGRRHPVARRRGSSPAPSRSPGSSRASSATACGCSRVPTSSAAGPVTCHNNLVGDVRNMGGRYVDRDVVVDGDLVTGRTGQHAHLFARQIIDLLAATRSAAPPAAPTNGARPPRGAQTRGALA